MPHRAAKGSRTMDCPVTLGCVRCRAISLRSLLLWGLLLLASSTDAAQCNANNASVVIDPGLDHESNGVGDAMAGVELLQTNMYMSGTIGHMSLTWMPSPQILRLVGGSITLAGFWLMLNVGNTDTLVSSAIFLDLFMTTILTPLAPTLTPSYQLIALLTSSKNVVTCLIAPFTGRFIDGNESRGENRSRKVRLMQPEWDSSAVLQIEIKW